MLYFEYESTTKVLLERRNEESNGNKNYGRTNGI